MIEIERKFLVHSEAFKNEAFKQTRICQGYLNSNKDRAVRIRIKGDLGYITVKGPSSPSGLSRFEWEREIDQDEALALLKLCEETVIDKIRYEVQVGEHVYEVDEFFGENQGLIVAEVELKSETQPYIKPEWLAQEVTGDIKYYNSQLSKNPFKLWK
ncbi:CYTH domain-containing protein [Tamlana sp. 2_MG-2023]|uniref:CYTH domain-containing protein n=1 Tax=unclassified Tamlana TaxID=2614803 RepID=UPI0026E288A7|nr:MULTISPECIES: CYTH domain-containing protein [unclassified Tamlana]MDO6761108.1 CYTH domain-containing protein [Tamlana sp. 2_MG-2023]MDO6791559.1 CYTH domain-containing protein [Tamlana sp. 1_MG-2023]